MTVEETFEDYLKICSMNAPINIKVRMLTNLLSAQPDPWRVVGITKQALLVFKKHKFKRNSKMGINRSHIISRSPNYKAMMQNIFLDCNVWWQFYFENDKTILATSSENMKSILSEIYNIPEELKLFKSNGINWVHREDEIKFLKKLYKEKIDLPNNLASHNMVGF